MIATSSQSRAERGSCASKSRSSSSRVCPRYNALTADRRGHVVPAVITVYEDRSFDVATKQPTTASLIRRVARLDGGSPRPGHQSAGVVTTAQLKEVATIKLPDLNTTDLDKAVRIVAGTARSMGLRVVD
jgi:Ribosomal protein L11